MRIQLSNNIPVIDCDPLSCFDICGLRGLLVMKSFHPVVCIIPNCAWGQKQGNALNTLFLDWFSKLGKK